MSQKVINHDKGMVFFVNRDVQFGGGPCVEKKSVILGDLGQRLAFGQVTKEAHLYGHVKKKERAAAMAL